jgi:hypothetical protein
MGKDFTAQYEDKNKTVLKELDVPEHANGLVRLDKIPSIGALRIKTGIKKNQRILLPDYSIF